MKGIIMKTIKRNVTTGAPTGAHNSPGRHPWIFGTVHSIEPSRQMLFLHQPQDDIDRIVHWQPQTRIRHHGAEVNPGALHQGQQNSVQFSDAAGHAFAKEINIVVEPPVSEAAREVTATQSESFCRGRRGNRLRK
jgi:hypothetical protein